MTIAKLILSSLIRTDPTKADFRTRHEALPVLEGTKYAANACTKTDAWTCDASLCRVYSHFRLLLALEILLVVAGIHMYDYQTAVSNGCN